MENIMDFKDLADLLFPNVTMTRDDLEERYPLRELPEGAVVSRMAPSPTGFVHLGNLVQGITSERMTHQSNGKLFLRVEDTDAKREVKGAIAILIDSLKHYGISFDEGETADGDVGEYGPYRQSRRADIYHVYAKELVERGMAYPCFCSEEELSDIRAKQEAEKANFGYFGKWAIWRDRSIEDIEKAIVANDDELIYSVIDDKNLYYVRSEYVESDDSETAYSLYKMDNDGHNVRKLVFNVDSVSAYDKNKLYFVKSEYLRYRVITPLKKGKTKERYETFYVTRYFEFDKATEKHELVLTLGLPEEKNVKKNTDTAAKDSVFSARFLAVAVFYKYFCKKSNHISTSNKSIRRN
jgi:hypothetical protein